MDITNTLTGALLGTLIVAAILTAPVALLLIALYRRAVIRLMSKRSHSVPTSIPIPKASLQRSSLLATRLELVLFDRILVAKDEATTSLYNKLRTRYWQAATVYILGGFAFTTLLTIAFFLSSDTDIFPLRFIYTALIHFWPTILVINLVALLEPRSSCLILAGYFFAWFVLTGIELVINPSFTWGQSILGWLLFNILPTTIVIMFLYRRIRAVGPMVFTFLAFGLSGLYLYQQEIEIFFRYLSGGEGASLAIYSWLLELGANLYIVARLLLVLSILLTITLGWFALQLLKWLYLHKRQSGQSLIIDPIWLIFGYFTSALMVFENPWWFLSFFVAFALYKIVTWTGFYFLHRRRRKVKGPELLLLRVFSLGKRSEQLYRAIAKAWRYVGNIRFITGPDLATATVEPHNFLDYISGRLRHHFIDSAETLERRIETADVFPGLDGRYRIHDFFCYDDTWKMALCRLAQDSDVILMDLRNFSRANAGCVFEINELINDVPLKRVVFVIDETTDEAFLRESMENASKRLSSDSPNREDCQEVHLFQYNERRSGGFDSLLHALSIAATSTGDLVTA